MAYATTKKIKTIPIVKGQKELEEYIRCANNAFYFILAYIRILHPVRGIVGFKMYDFQVQALKYIMLNQFSISLKPRQMGMSTLLCAYLLWYAMFNPNKNILIISIKMNVAKSFLRKMKGMYLRLPDFLKMEVLNGQDSCGTATEILFANGSQIHISAATTDAGRSEALSFLFLDEVAFQGAANEIWGAAQPTLSTGGKAVMVSTAYGMGNLFHKTWTEAVEGKNGFFPIKLNWRQHPERDMAWYTEQSRLLGEKRTAQEIDCDFLKSGYNVFDLTDIKVIEERLQDSMVLEERNGGDFKMFHFPDPNRQYVIGADIATGRARDYSAFSVMDYDGKEYACYKGKIDPRAFSHLLMEIGELYNMALLAPEVNGVGEGPIAMLQEHYYPNIYAEVAMTKNVNAHDPVESVRYGWYTGGKSRTEMITGMDEDLINDEVEMCNPYFVQEAKTFIYNENGKAVALGKELGKSQNDMYADETSIVYTDDSIMAACITNAVRKRATSYKGALPIVGG